MFGFNLKTSTRIQDQAEHFNNFRKLLNIFIFPMSCHCHDGMCIPSTVLGERIVLAAPFTRQSEKKISMVVLVGIAELTAGIAELTIGIAELTVGIAELTVGIAELLLEASHAPDEWRGRNFSQVRCI
ncbi:hypothetical protein CEXT_3051 [Caerostris extrusa]|uniref:Uncharacterized protein n=1 Tax=Caerostris extrusa TaxID=172846 RepID=A0AAV4VLG3_CAEEX|nr:hypothetical protein CEXT_3051 [Caerostris extrusa]